MSDQFRDYPVSQVHGPCSIVSSNDIENMLAYCAPPRPNNQYFYRYLWISDMSHMVDTHFQR